MITTITLNPCIDKTIEIDTFKLGKTNIVRSVREHIGGKGINVSVVLGRLNVENKAAGFIYREDERRVMQFLQNEGCRTCFTEAAGRLRTNVKIFERNTGRMSELNEKGKLIDSGDLDRFFEELDENLKDTSIAVINGSVPPGVPADTYKRIIQRANENGIITVLDASGELLRKGIEANPFLVKPNLQELEETFQKKLDTLEKIVHMGQELVKGGVKYVCISLGSEGAVLVTDAHAFFAEPLQIEVRGVQGAGDSMVAGFCYGISNGCSEEEIFRYGMACAAASLIRPGTELCKKKDIEKMLPLVRITCLKGKKVGELYGNNDEGNPF